MTGVNVAMNDAQVMKGLKSFANPGFDIRSQVFCIKRLPLLNISDLRFRFE